MLQSLATVPALAPSAEALDIVSRGVLPALILEVPSERVVAASDSAARLLGGDAEGRPLSLAAEWR